MSSHHDHHDSHVNESKPVAFRTPLILALVTVLLILLAVSTCDGHHKSACDCSEPCTPECMKECESGDHSGHSEAVEEHHATENTEHAAEVQTTDSLPITNTTVDTLSAHPTESTNATTSH